MNAEESKNLGDMMERNAPINFRQAVNKLGVTVYLADFLMDASSSDARQRINCIAKSIRQAVADAYEQYLIESGRVVFRLATVRIVH